VDQRRLRDELDVAPPDALADLAGQEVAEMGEEVETLPLPSEASGKA
jgi:hypothetical protein